MRIEAPIPFFSSSFSFSFCICFCFFIGFCLCFCLCFYFGLSNSATTSSSACPLSMASVYYSPSSLSSFMIIVILNASLYVYNYINWSQRNTTWLRPNIRLDRGQILTITLRQPARREARCCPIYFLTSFYMVESFNYLGYIVRTPTDSFQHRWPPGLSASDLFSLLEIFTWLDHRNCTGIKICSLVCTRFPETNMLSVQKLEPKFGHNS